MKIRSIVVCLMSLAATILLAQHPRTAPLAPSESIANIGPMLQQVNALKAELRQYHACTCKCGCYTKDVDAEADRAIAFLRKRAASQKRNEKLALVLDIDETALSNWAELNAANFEYDKSEFNAWIESARAPAIEGTVRLYEEARRLGVAAFFVTGRPEGQRAPTEANLRLRGFNGWEKLVMRSGEEKGMTALAYKSAQRKKIVASGYSIVLNVGDQWSDLKGEAQAEFSVKYPDPFYLVK